MIIPGASVVDDCIVAIKQLFGFCVELIGNLMDVKFFPTEAAAHSQASAHPQNFQDTVAFEALHAQPINSCLVNRALSG